LATLDAGIITEATARADADAASSVLISNLTATVSSNDTNVKGLIVSESTTRATADSALADNLSVISAAVSTNLTNTNAAITAEATARANADDATATTISSLSASVAGKNRTFSQNAAPTTGMIAGDLWFDADDGNKAYRYSGTAWVATDDTRIAANAAAITAEATARATADSATATTISTLTSTVNSKNKTYSQATAPTTGLVAGDLWFNTADNNKTYRYTGTAWVIAEDNRISTNSAAIVTEANTRATQGSSGSCFSCKRCSNR